MNSNNDHGVHRNSAHPLWAAVVKLCEGENELIEDTLLNCSTPDRENTTDGILWDEVDLSPVEAQSMAAELG